MPNFIVNNVLWPGTLLNSQSTAVTKGQTLKAQIPNSDLYPDPNDTANFVAYVITNFAGGMYYIPIQGELVPLPSTVAGVEDIIQTNYYYSSLLFIPHFPTLANESVFPALRTTIFAIQETINRPVTDFVAALTCEPSSKLNVDTVTSTQTGVPELVTLNGGATYIDSLNSTNPAIFDYPCNQFIGFGPATTPIHSPVFTLTPVSPLPDADQSILDKWIILPMGYGGPVQFPVIQAAPPLPLTIPEDAGYVAIACYKTPSKSIIEKYHKKEEIKEVLDVYLHNRFGYVESGTANSPFDPGYLGLASDAGAPTSNEKISILMFEAITDKLVALEKSIKELGSAFIQSQNRPAVGNDITDEANKRD